jgi:hypothetical protein
VVSGSSDGTIKAWNTQDGSLIATGEGHTRDAWALGVTQSPDVLIVSGSFDRTLRVWDLSPVLGELCWLRRRNFCLFLSRMGYCKQQNPYLPLAAPAPAPTPAPTPAGWSDTATGNGNGNAGNIESLGAELTMEAATARKSPVAVEVALRNKEEEHLQDRFASMAVNSEPLPLNASAGCCASMAPATAIAGSICSGRSLACARSGGGGDKQPGLPLHLPLPPPLPLHLVSPPYQQPASHSSASVAEKVFCVPALYRTIASYL